MEKSTFEKKLTCTECRFHDKLMHDETGIVTICRLNPPIVAHCFVPTAPGKGDVLTQTLWPVMGLGDWCGKLETKSN